MVQKARWNVNTRGLVGSTKNKPLGWDPNAIVGLAKKPTPIISTQAQAVARTVIQRAQIPLNRKLLRAKLRETFNLPQLEVQEINGEYHFSIQTQKGNFSFKIDSKRIVHPLASSDLRESGLIQQRIQNIVKEF